MVNYVVLGYTKYLFETTNYHCYFSLNPTAKGNGKWFEIGEIIYDTSVKIKK